MPFDLSLPPGLAAQGWKVKIRDRERVEPPHATIIRGTTAWRFDLRRERFLDEEPDPRGVPSLLIAEIRAHLVELRSAWDERYPENPIESKDNLDD